MASVTTPFPFISISRLARAVEDGSIVGPNIAGTKHASENHGFVLAVDEILSLRLNHSRIHWAVVRSLVPPGL